MIIILHKIKTNKLKNYLLYSEGRKHTDQTHFVSQAVQHVYFFVKMGF